MKSKRPDHVLGGALIGAVLLAASGVALGDTINLTAAPANAALPDGESVPMWGYSCDATQPAAGSNPAGCRALKTGTGWSPVLITVGAGSLTIHLTNNLPTPPGAGSGIPTSLVIVGQLGGGLGTDPASRSNASPDHPHQGTTWPGTRGEVSDPTSCGGDTGIFCPPAQGARVQSFGTEVATGSAQNLTWANLRPGTYLIESGTHPSIQGAMGLYGVLVVTAPGAGPAHFAYPDVTYDSDVPLLLSEIDPVQNRAVATAVGSAGFSETKVWSGQAGKCGDVPPSPTAVSGEANTCYPPAVNYSPRYYLVNGVSFDRSAPAASRFTYASATGNVLVRFVNAGLRMHAPSIVGALTGSGIPGMTLIAEDGNPVPGAARVQSDVLLPAGKTYDVMINAPAGTAPLPVFDRQLSLSTNNQRDGGMQAYINAISGSAPAAASGVANPDTYYKISGNTLTVGDVGKGVLANDIGVTGAHVVGATPAGLSLNPNGTFRYTGAAGATFTYCGNGATSGSACATVSLAACAGGCLGAAPVAADDAYTGKLAQRLQIAPPGILTNDSDPSGLPITVDTPSVTPDAGLDVKVNADGSFVATAAPGSTHTFTYLVKNSQNSPSAASATVTLHFASPNNINFAVRDAKNGTTLTDYRWIIEEDRTVDINPAVETLPACTGSNPPLAPPACSDTPVRNLAVNFHSSHMPVIATGCTGPLSCEGPNGGMHGQTVLDPATGEHVAAVCDVGNGACRADLSGTGRSPVNPGEVALDPGKRYYISVLPGDAANDTEAGDPAHSMGGASISSSQVAGGSATTVNISVQPLPFPTAQISVFVFQDDYPLNGESDTGGGVDVLAPNEPGLGGFSIVLLDQTGQFGDPAGQLTYDEFGEPVSNSLAHTIDPTTGLDACPISPKSTDSLVGMIVTCPTYEANADGTLSTVLSPLAGHALIKNMYPGLYEVHTTPGADRIANGEEWLQTNTLDGTKDIEAFVKPDEPSYFQEFGPGGYHVAVGFANPAIINARKSGVCQGQTCTAKIYGKVTGLRMSRTPDQRVYSSGSYDTYGFAQCYVSLGAPDSADFAFTKCNSDGTFSFEGLPQGNFKVTVFDQWNDLLVDGLSTPIKVTGASVGSPDAPIEVAVTQWRTNLYGRIFLDQNGDGVSQEEEPGLPLVPFNIRYRDGSYMGFNNTDLAGNAGFNEVFPFLNWLVVDTDSARYKQAGAHVVYDWGGPADGTTGGGGSSIGAGFANTKEKDPVPAALRVPGARYCASADCPAGDTAGGSSGRVDPGWVPSEGWQGLLGQNSFIEFAMRNFAPTENGGIRGHVIYTSTRPFDDPALLLQLSWEPGVANVKMNLYQEGTATDGTRTLKLVDTTTTSSWDDWAQGFRRNSDGSIAVDADGRAIPNMSCPGQDDQSPFYYTMKDSTQALHPDTPMAANARFKCYDGWSMLNQVQPAPYNGMYKFPSVVAKAGTTQTLPAAGEETALQFDPASYKTNCTICTTGPDGAPMLPPGKYVVEVVLPDGYELVKEEDKNILLGDVYIAPEEAQFPGFGAIFIMPDQAQVNAYYNRNNELQQTTNNNASPRREGDTGSVEVFWPCVGAQRIVPDYNSLFPGAEQLAPFAGATRPLCDRKEVTLDNQMTALAKFYLFTSAHVAGHYTGTITNDFASEFDPFSPQFGEKFAVPNVPVAIKDFTGKEITRVYADQWGLFNGLTYSTWTVNPPSPSGYIPQMMIACMNDPGPIPGPNGTTIPDPAYNPAYSNFCYEIPFMPGETAYLDTPVIPTMAFADGYNLPDCDYPDLTPAIASVLGDAIPGSAGGRGPWVSAAGAGHTLTINALGNKQVLNHAYSGPRATTAPYNQKFITRHYGFGSRPANCPASGNCLSATVAGVPLVNVTTWTNDQVIGTVPTISNSQSTCTVAQRTTPQSLGQSARCGQLVITAANGKKSIDTVTVTVAGKTPRYVTPDSPSSNLFGRIVPSPVQTAIDGAASGDLLILAPGTYRENLLMWKPVRLQGVGAYSVTINADAHPAGKLDAWRRETACVFGLDAQGQPTNRPYGDCPASMLGRVDRMPLEGIIGWDTTANGNLAQQLQEPTLMGAYEGAGITVLGRGIRLPNGTTPPQRFGVGNESAYPDGFSYLSNGNQDCNLPNNPNGTNAATTDYGTSNFLCNPSRIDGVSVINSSQGGGAIFAHGWNHLLEVSNTRVYANHGTLTGGITIGSGEFPDPYLAGGDVPLPNNLPANGLVAGEQAGYGFNRNVRVHNNSVTSNASIGDALYSSTNSGGGGVSFCTGADGYRFNENWVCGNLSSGDGGGVVHSGFSNDGTIANNTIIFNQSQSPTIPVNGGGLAILGASPDPTFTSGPNAGQECGTVNDADCPPGLAEGTGRNLLIDANLIVGNSAESGTGGGLRLQLVNGQDVAALPRAPTRWNDVRITNNIITNNVAGWDGGGVSLQDALRVTFINNTVMNNDTTASAGVLFNTLGAPLGATPPPGCNPQQDPTQPQDPSCDNPVPTSTNQPAGFVTMPNTPNLVAAINDLPGIGIVICPSGNSSGLGAALPIPNGDCRRISFPAMRNNLFWHNRAFHVEVTDPSTDPEEQTNQQSVVTLVPSLDQLSTGFCAAMGTSSDAPGSGGPVNYWDIGVRGDATPAPNSGSGFALEPRNSILTNASAYPGPLIAPYNNLGSDPAVLRQYCNGARLPPENGGHGYNAPAGRSETTGLYTVFALNQITPAATVDEGNNWINLGFGPLSLVNPVDGQTVLGNYSPGTASPAINHASASGAPNLDFFGTSRPQAGGYDIGAVEVVLPPADFSVTKTDGRTTVVRGTNAVTYTIVVTNNGPSAGSGTLSDNLQSNSRYNVTAWSCVASAGSSCAATGSGGSRSGAFTLLNGGTATYTLVGNVPASAPTGSSTNSVTVTGDNDNNPSNNSASDTDTIVQALAFTAESGPGAFSPDGTTLEFGNLSGAQSDTVTVTAAAAVTFGTASVANSTGSAFSKGADTCSGNPLVAGASCTIVVNFNAPAGTNNRVGNLSVPFSGAGGSPLQLALTGR